jgi:AraC family transcriptional activator FtrA
VAAVAYDGVAFFELAIAVEIFGLPRPELDVPWYDFSVCRAEPGWMSTTARLRLSAPRPLAALDRADTIIIPGWRNPAEPPPHRLLAALRRAYARGARLVSICSGVFVLAAAGVLAGKRATTHWRYVALLRETYPDIRVEPDVLFVDEGRVLTSAGSAAGIDLCLHLVRLDHGARIANEVARRLVVAPQREGGQAQFIPEPVRPRAGHGLARAMDWALGHLDEELSLGRWARAAATSTRTLARRFRAETGGTPHRWLTHQRVLAAQRLLESSPDSIEEIAGLVGFGSAQTLRLHFARALRTSPAAYRRRFFTGTMGRAGKDATADARARRRPSPPP